MFLQSLWCCVPKTVLTRSLLSACKVARGQAVCLVPAKEHKKQSFQLTQVLSQPNYCSQICNNGRQVSLWLPVQTRSPCHFLHRVAASVLAEPNQVFSQRKFSSGHQVRGFSQFASANTSCRKINMTLQDSESAESCCVTGQSTEETVTLATSTLDHKRLAPLGTTG